MSLPPALASTLASAKYMYLTTYARSGKAGTVPVWLWFHDGLVYFTTQRASLKARRIKATGRVTVRAGREDGPGFEGRAEWVDDRPDLEQALLAAYRRKYWLLVPLWMGRRIRKGLAAKTSVLIRITPALSGQRSAVSEEQTTEAAPCYDAPGYVRRRRSVLADH